MWPAPWSGTYGADQRHRGAPAPAPVPPALPLLYWSRRGGRGETPIFVKGPRPLACHATPALGDPARQGEGAAVSIYLTGPHSPSHAMYRGQGRLWGKRATPSSPWDNRGSQGLWREQRGGDGWLLPGEGTSAVFSGRRLRSALRGLHGPGSGKQGTSPSPFSPSFPK